MELCFSCTADSDSSLTIWHLIFGRRVREVSLLKFEFRRLLVRVSSSPPVCGSRCLSSLLEQKFCHPLHCFNCHTVVTIGAAENHLTVLRFTIFYNSCPFSVYRCWRLHCVKDGCVHCGWCAIFKRVNQRDLSQIEYGFHDAPPAFCLEIIGNKNPWLIYLFPSTTHGIYLFHSWPIRRKDGDDDFFCMFPMNYHPSSSRNRLELQ